VRSLIVVDRPEQWPHAMAGVEVVPARRYLVEPDLSDQRGVKVFNLCRSYRYQSIGYYVSLLATARGHRPVPSVATIQDLKSTEIVRIRSEDLDELMQKSLAPIKADTFVLSIYFGKNVAERHSRLAARIFALFEAPLMRASFRRGSDDHWRLLGVKAIATDDVPPSHHEFLMEVARDYFAKRRRGPKVRRRARYDLAILIDPADENPPSDKHAIGKFQKAARAEGLEPTLITKADYASVAEFDALFIRETTNVNHHTYRFARRAASEGMVVIDDPESILRCTNKVYLAELLERHGVPAPVTVVIHRGNIDDAVAELGLPCVLKRPDSSFSQGVTKVKDLDALHREADIMLASSELIVGQAFTPTDFDWRVGVLGGEPLWVCRYHMAQGHWQIIKTGSSGRQRWGRVEAVPLADAPSSVVRMAVRAANLIGDGLYGVDLKQIGRRVCVIEVNDNPTIESGEEDVVVGDELYRRLMRLFVERLDTKREEAR
jgi:glutathione synthase/RimK-type ligase-like ATP-grasp enzyme